MSPERESQNSAEATQPTAPTQLLDLEDFRAWARGLATEHFATRESFQQALELFYNNRPHQQNCGMIIPPHYCWVLNLADLARKIEECVKLGPTLETIQSLTKAARCLLPLVEGLFEAGIQHPEFLWQFAALIRCVDFLDHRAHHDRADTGTSDVGTQTTASSDCYASAKDSPALNIPDAYHTETFPSQTQEVFPAQISSPVAWQATQPLPVQIPTSSTTTNNSTTSTTSTTNTNNITKTTTTTTTTSPAASTTSTTANTTTTPTKAVTITTTITTTDTTTTTVTTTTTTITTPTTTTTTTTTTTITVPNTTEETHASIKDPQPVATSS